VLFFSFFHIFSASNFIANRQITSNLFAHHIICMQPDTRKGFIHFNRQNLKIINIDNTIFLHILDITYHLILPAKKILSPKKIKIIGRNYILEKFIVTTRVS